jgi:hypothetical protein
MRRVRVALRTELLHFDLAKLRWFACRSVVARAAKLARQSHYDSVTHIVQASDFSDTDRGNSSIDYASWRQAVTRSRMVCARLETKNPVCTVKV